ncbi:MAG: MATE family efflux transporter, partial [Methanobacterium sp.]|nr:MATE family efflux transporter [Methanobacterium sp.]
MNYNKEHSEQVDQRISMVTGDPKRAIRVLSVPMIISMMLIMAYNLADSIWVAGLGAEA